MAMAGVKFFVSATVAGDTRVLNGRRLCRLIPALEQLNPDYPMIFWAGAEQPEEADCAVVVRNHAGLRAIKSELKAK